jgi:hypothetical protein
MLNAVILQLSGIRHKHLEPTWFLLYILFSVDVFVRGLCLINLKLPKTVSKKFVPVNTRTVNVCYLKTLSVSKFM